MADFVLGRLKFKWRGDWAASTAYLIDDIVKYGGNNYVVTSNHTSQAATANFYTDLAAGKYELQSESLFFKRGIPNSLATYCGKFSAAAACITWFVCS